MRPISRRTFLASSAAAAVVACTPGGSGGGSKQGIIAPQIASDGTQPPPPTAPATPTVTPTPTPIPLGVEQRTLLAGTSSETQMIIRHSGVRGPAVMILGGVHGNEPAGWLAGDEVATWAPKAGSLIVVPRANVRALNAFVRTFDDIGDLNRLYPGNAESPLLMERMSHAFLETCREFNVEILLDMHESWAFYAEYPPNSGTGALGQTITAGVGPKQNTIAQQMAEIANPQATAREQFIIRDGTRFSRPDGTPVGSGPSSRGRSSLSAGTHVQGLTPILVEMGQETQALDRRIELHLITARALLGIEGIL